MSTRIAPSRALSLGRSEEGFDAPGGAAAGRAAGVWVVRSGGAERRRGSGRAVEIGISDDGCARAAGGSSDDDGRAAAAGGSVAARRFAGLRAIFVPLSSSTPARFLASSHKVTVPS